ncbi:RICIN domain-containing protein [Glycomyces sp. NPDC021274]|uniref:RICIN domain-containing protein n=1 Tax=Glycomyces sp. NPDC021274 TaxID=3155120 RepID=UPI0033C70D44
MAMQRRTFLNLGAAGALGVGVSLLGTAQAHAAPAPANPFAVGVRRYDWYRGTRPVTTYVYYPAAGTAGGTPVADAPVANGVFPVYAYTHGLGGNPANSTFAPGLASAGFIVPSPHFQHSLNDVNSGNTSRDVSQVLTNTLALNTSGPLAGHVRTDIGVGACGHSMGGMTTHGLLTSWPDSRIISANPQSCLDMGNPSSSVNAKVLFVHGDQDGTTAYSSGRQAYNEITWPKAFLTFVGGSHNSFWDDLRFRNTVRNWAQWTMYGDTAARDRLPVDAAGSNTKWEAALGGNPNGPGSYRLIAQHSGKYADINGVSTAAGALLHQWSGTGRTNQQFQFVDAGEGHFKIKASHSGLVLQVASNSNGADITQQADTGAHSQHWRLTDHGNNVVSIINRQSGLAMDVWGYSSADGARISQYTPNGNANQRFTRQAV